MDIRGTLLVSILSLGVVAGAIYGYQYYFDENTNISSLEAIDIAKSDEYVQNWIIQNRASASASYTEGIWNIRFVAALTPGLFLLVRVDDLTAEIMSTETLNLGGNQNSLGQPEGDFIRSPNENQQDMVYDDREASLGYFEDTCEGGIYADCGVYYEPDPEFVEQAISFVNSLVVISEFLDENDMEFYVSSYSWDDKNRAYVWAWSERDLEEYFYLNINLNFEETEEKIWEFTLNNIESNVIFGDTLNNLDDINQLIEESSEFQNYSYTVENYTSYNYYTYSVATGFIFDVSYYPEYNWYYDDYERDETQGDEPDNPTYPEDLYRWIEFIVRDDTSTIIEIWGTYSNQMTEDDVMQIVLLDDGVKDWLLNVNSYTHSAHYNDRGSWWIYLVEDEDYYTYAYLNVNDKTGEISEFYSAVSVPATLTDQEVRDIVLSAEGASKYFHRVIESYSDLFYDQYGTWWVYYYDVEDWRNSLYLQVNDTDGSIMQLRMLLTKPAEMSDTNVINKLLGVGLQEFLDTYENVEVYNYYDGYGIHYLYAYDRILLEASAWGSVNDTSGDVISFDAHHPAKLPTMSTKSVLQLAHTSSEYSKIFGIVDEIFEYIYFYGGMWYFYAFGFDQDNYYSLSISIDDETGLIIDEYNYNWDYTNYRDDDDEWNEPVEPKNP